MIDRLFALIARRFRKLLRVAVRIFDALCVKKVIDFLKGFFDGVPEFLGRFSLRRLFKYCWMRLRQCRGNPMEHKPGRRHMIGASLWLLALIAMGFPIPAWAATTVLVAHTGDNSDGSTWAKAFTSVTNALSGRAVGDIVLVSNAHVLVPPAAAISYAPPAGAIYLICVTPSGLSGNSGVATGADEAVGAAGANIQINNIAGGAQWYIYGMTLEAGTTGNANIYVFGAGTQASSGVQLVNCTLKINTTSTNTGIVLGTNGAKDNYIRLYGCVLSCASRTGLFLEPYVTVCDIINCTLSMGASMPSPLVQMAYHGITTFRDCDLTGWNPTTGALVAANLQAGRVVFENCKMPSNFTGVFGTTGITPATGTWLTGEGSVAFINSDNANTAYIFGYVNAFGTLGASTSIYQDAGAQFNGAGASWKITTTALASPARPFRTPYFNMWGTSTSAETPSVEIVRDNATGLTDQDVWLDVHYVSAQGAAGPLGSMASSRNAQPISAVGSANTYASSSVAWTGISGFTNQNKQTVALGATITPATANRIKGRFAVGVASTTLYVNPGLAGTT